MACMGLVGGGEGVEVHEVSVSGDDTKRRWNFFRGIIFGARVGRGGRRCEGVP